MTIKSQLFVLVLGVAGLFGLSVGAYFIFLAPAGILQREAETLDRLSVAIADLEETVSQFDHSPVLKVLDKLKAQTIIYHEADNHISEIQMLNRLGPTLADAISTVSSLRELGDPALDDLNSNLGELVGRVDKDPEKYPSGWTLESLVQSMNTTGDLNGEILFNVSRTRTAISVLMDILTASRAAIAKNNTVVLKEIQAINFRSSIYGTSMVLISLLTALGLSLLVARNIHLNNKRNHLSLVHALKEIADQRDQLKQKILEIEKTQKHLIQSEKQAVLGQLIAGMAHELNTPLGVAVTGISYLREQTEIHDESGKLLSLVQSSLERAHKLVENLKQVSAVTGGHGPERFNLAEFVRNQVDTIVLGGDNPNLSVSFHGPDPLELVNFPDFLGRVLAALVQNSLTHAFTSKGPGKISIGWRLREDQQIQISFEDNGKGLSPEDLTHLFEPFRGSLQRKETPGLGTFTIYHLTTAGLGGTITVTSHPGSGVRYELTIPDRSSVF